MASADYVGAFHLHWVCIMEAPMIRQLERMIAEHSKFGTMEGEERIRFFTLALCGEVGELANYVKKDWRGDDDVIQRRVKIIEELADIANYTFMLASLLGIDLEEVMLRKLLEFERKHAVAKASC